MAFLKPQYLFLPLLIFFLLPKLTFANQSRINGLKRNVNDQCWRKNPEWRRHRYQLATCSMGYAGKMIKNIGNDLIYYKVTDSSDDPINPKPNTLRYGTSVIQGNVWITFQKDMQIKLEKPLLISSFTTIDGRGVNVHIAHNACLMIFKVLWSRVSKQPMPIHMCERFYGLGLPNNRCLYTLSFL
ncbi:hypothetical protein VIGAN_11163500 [Vigna angularis var. angularis]|uniref:Uncharacterized protein n=1 Tax=Vigna angularis var. angularis TaxID=157739 RepID=A0A0S3TB87_PHAAN|nr:hypothetical protein VIGAN_11163500 [Vigna angularis var. angularis]